MFVIEALGLSVGFGSGEPHLLVDGSLQQWFAETAVHVGKFFPHRAPRSRTVACGFVEETKSQSSEDGQTVHVQGRQKKLDSNRCAQTNGVTCSFGSNFSAVVFEYTPPNLFTFPLAPTELREYPLAFARRLVSLNEGLKKTCTGQPTLPDPVPDALETFRNMMWHEQPEIWQHVQLSEVFKYIWGGKRLRIPERLAPYIPKAFPGTI